jgi:hypothetical protein
MSWLEVGDKLVKRTGLYRMTMIEPAEPRPLRWWPLLILIAVAVGYAMIVTVADPMILRSPFTQVSFVAVIVANFMFFAGFTMANYIRFLGPRLGSRMGSELVDERERAVRAEAFAMSGSFLAWCAVLGCFWIGMAPFLGGWVPATALEWVYLGMGFEAWVLTLPVLIASWLQPRPDPGGSDEV